MHMRSTSRSVSPEPDPEEWPPEPPEPSDEKEPEVHCPPGGHGTEYPEAPDEAEVEPILPQRPPTRDEFLGELDDLMGNTSEEYTQMIRTYNAAQLEEEIDVNRGKLEKLRTFLGDLDHMLRNDTNHEDWLGFLGPERQKFREGRSVIGRTLASMVRFVNATLTTINPEDKEAIHYGALAMYAGLIKRTLEPLGTYAPKLEDHRKGVLRFHIDYMAVNRAARDAEARSFLADPDARPAKRRRVDTPESSEVSVGTQVIFALALVFGVWAIGEVGSS